jgi:hypothetical protein
MKSLFAAITLVLGLVFILQFLVLLGRDEGGKPARFVRMAGSSTFADQKERGYTDVKNFNYAHAFVLHPLGAGQQFVWADESRKFLFPLS